MKSLESWKADLWLSTAIREAKKNPGTDKKKLIDGFERVPVRQMYDQLQQLENAVLPSIKQKRGDNADYLFFSAVARSMLWAIHIVDRFEFLQRENTRLKLQNTLTLQHAEHCERELQKYITLEDLFFSDGLDMAAQAVKDKISSRLKPKKETV
jgi:hypothetical protein